MKEGESDRSRYGLALAAGVVVAMVVTQILGATLMYNHLSSRIDHVQDEVGAIAL